MTYIKRYLKCSLIYIILLLLLPFILTLLNYINVIPSKTTTILLKVTLFISILVASYLFGQKSKNKGWLEGIKFAIPFILFFIIINGFNIYNIIYYLSFILCSIFGSVIGINRKKGD